jgi:CheY-like chemotaxis protein
MPRSTAILIVEDEYGLAELLRDLLTECGYDVSLAINGRLALDVLREKEIHVVVTDVMMPIMDGPELARAMREDERHRQIPIVLMTSRRSAMPPAAGLYDAVLIKPFTPAALMKVLQEYRRDGNPPTEDCDAGGLA